MISRSWPSYERSGVSLAAAQHVDILLNAGHDVSIIGSSKLVMHETLNVSNRYFVLSTGTGSVYSKAHIDKRQLVEIFNKTKPDLIVIEAWQTALTDAAVDVATGLSLPLLMISHGISLHKFSNSILDIIRSLFWWSYRLKLKKRIANLKVMTALDLESKSKRLYDRDIAINQKVSVLQLVNTPINWMKGCHQMINRKKQIVCVGYFSAIKNQLAAIEIFSELPNYLELVFIGSKSGSYYKKCIEKVKQKGLGSRVIFYEDSDCNIAEEISQSLVMLCTSRTEVLPISLLEAMASNTPFVAPEVGAIPSLKAGILANGQRAQENALMQLINDEHLWKAISDRGRLEYLSRFTLDCVAEDLKRAVSVATSSYQNKVNN